MTIFILWKKTKDVNTIELIIEDVEEFKQQYKKHKHLTFDERCYVWTRENIKI